MRSPSLSPLQEDYLMATATVSEVSNEHAISKNGHHHAAHPSSFSIFHNSPTFQMACNLLNVVAVVRH